MAAGEVDCVVTGADRIAANGDTANKIGTYSLAVLAAHHGIPLYVVAPTSTVDLSTPIGRGDSDRGARSVRDHRALPRLQPGLRRHAGRADRRRSSPSTASIARPTPSRSRRSYEGADPRSGLRDAAASAHGHDSEAAAAGRRPSDGGLDPRPDRGDERRRDPSRHERALRGRLRALGRRQGRPGAQRRDDVERRPAGRDRRHPLRRARRRPARDRRRQPLRRLARGLRALLARAGRQLRSRCSTSATGSWRRSTASSTSTRTTGSRASSRSPKSRRRRSAQPRRTSTGANMPA